jgi:hypothetical protein
LKAVGDSHLGYHAIILFNGRPTARHSGEGEFSAVFQNADRRRRVLSAGTLYKDGSYTTEFHEETWHIPGATGKLVFDRELLQCHLDEITALLSSLADAAPPFAQSRQPVKPSPLERR